jgi:NAD-specific glutamate dehydrogenase
MVGYQSECEKAIVQYNLRMDLEKQRMDEMIGQLIKARTSLDPKYNGAPLDIGKTVESIREQMQSLRPVYRSWVEQELDKTIKAYAPRPPLPRNGAYPAR